MEVPRLGVKSELQLPAYATATATVLDPSHICDLHPSSQQRQILNPLNKARDGTQNLMVPSWIVSALPQWELQAFIFKLLYNMLANLLKESLKCLLGI